tara:strand:+ start:360 stop:2120 length:1761 start_codon:yes stop_codon:yes gene_type:complete
MSRARGLISGANVESRTSGMYDYEDNIRIAAISLDGLKKIGMETQLIWTTGQTDPYDFAWSPDGLHLYLAYNGDYIRHYTVTEPFTTTGSSEQATFNHSTYDSTSYAMEVSPDGRYLYFGGTGKDTILQFTMGTDWNISSNANNTTFSPGYEQLNKRLDNIFGIGSADASIRGFTFNGNGTKLYLVGFGDDNIQQFALSTAYAVGTASYEGAYSFSGYGDPYAVRWNNNGTKLFMVDTNDDKIVEYSVQNAYDITSGTITENASYSTASYESSPKDVAFNSDGTKMFTVGNGGDEINEWSLSVGFDLTSTITHLNSQSLGSTNPTACDFSPDGTKFVFVDYGTDQVESYNLSTGFDTTTMSSAIETIDLSPTTWPHPSYLTNYFATPAGCRFNGDGTTISFLDRYSSSYDKLVSIPLTTAYDLRSFSDGSVDAATRGVDFPATCRFNRDGTKFYILDGNDDKIYQWSLAVPYVLGRGSTAMVYDGATSALTEADPNLRSFDWTPDGKAIFTCGNSNDTISFYTVSTPFDVTSTVTYKHSVDTTGWETTPYSIRVVNCYNKVDGTSGYKLHSLGTGSDKLYEFDINF